MEGPEAFLARLEIELPCPVAEGERALLVPELRTAVNGHLFWVSSDDRLAAFREDPARYTGDLLDPVTHAWFTPTSASPRLDRAGEILLFASVATRDGFLRDPTPADRHAHRERVPADPASEPAGSPAADGR